MRQKEYRFRSREEEYDYYRLRREDLKYRQTLREEDYSRNHHRYSPDDSEFRLYDDYRRPPLRPQGDRSERDIRRLKDDPYYRERYRPEKRDFSYRDRHYDSPRRSISPRRKEELYMTRYAPSDRLRGFHNIEKGSPKMRKFHTDGHKVEQAFGRSRYQDDIDDSDADLDLKVAVIGKEYSEDEDNRRSRKDKV